MGETPEAGRAMPCDRFEVCRRVGRHVRAQLVSGLFVVVPLVITVLVLRVAYASFTAFLVPWIRPFLHHFPSYVLSFVAFLLSIVVLYVAGVITRHVIGRRMIRLAEAVLLRLPIIKTVYASSKQVVDALSPTGKSNFKAVVLIAFPHSESRAIAFLTGSMRDDASRLLYRVFVPTTPNPTSGFLLLLPEEGVQFTDLAVEDGIKMVISGGMLAPERFTRLTAPPLPSSPVAAGSPAGGAA